MVTLRVTKYWESTNRTGSLGADRDGSRRHGDHSVAAQRRNHPLHPKNAKSPADFAPNQETDFCGRTSNFADTRWNVRREVRLSCARTWNKGRQKIGPLLTARGWVAYLNSGVFVRERSSITAEGARSTRDRGDALSDVLERGTCWKMEDSGGTCYARARSIGRN